MAFFLKGVEAALLRDCPDNVHFLGWRDDMVEVYKNSTVVLRLAEHDALGCTVVEGLAMARHVIYNYPVPFTTKVSFDDVDGLVAAISGLWDKHASGTLHPNLTGRCWAESTYDEGRLSRTLCRALADKRGECSGKADRCDENDCGPATNSGREERLS